MYIPKTIVITPSVKELKYTKEIITRIKMLNPKILIKYSNADNIKTPIFNNLSNQMRYLKETIILRNRAGSFITTFASPGDIIEEMCVIVSMGWHCVFECEYCYLQASIRNNGNHLLYTNLEKLDSELEIEPYIHRILLTILSAHSFINKTTLMKVPYGFHEVGNKIRKQLQNSKTNQINSDSLAIKYLKDNLEKYLHEIKPDSSHSLIKPMMKDFDKLAKKWMKDSNLNRNKCGKDLHSIVSGVRRKKYIVNPQNIKNDLTNLQLNHPSCSKTIDRLIEKTNVKPVDYSVLEISKVISKIANYYKKNKKYKPRLNISEYTDAVGIQHISKNLDIFMKYFQKHDNIEMVLPTKSSNIDDLLKYDGLDRALITINFNTDYFISTFEHGTSSLADRITAGKKVQDANGFKLNVAIEPMFFYNNYIDDYKKLVNRLMKELDKNGIGTIILGTARFGSTLKRTLVDIHPKTDVFQKNKPLLPIKGDDSKWRYEDGLREEMYKEIINEFEKYGEFYFFLGAETPEMWKKVGLNPKNHMSKFIYQY